MIIPVGCEQLKQALLPSKSWSRNMSKGKVLVSGASGLIGRAISSSLAAQGYVVNRLTRKPSGNSDDVAWDPTQPIAPEKVSGFDAVIHLAGENIFGVWTKEKKQRILDSRVVGTKNLVDGLSRAEIKPRVFLCASAIGYYGNRGNEILSEDSASGDGFLAEVCREWEAATTPAKDAGIRTVNIRTGIVLSSKDGALKKMLPAFRLGVGGKLGSGKQWWSWIHIDDMIGAVQYALEQASLSGPVNFVGPNPATNAELTLTLAHVLSRPAFFNVPAFVLRLALGHSADELLLASQRVEPEKLRAAGYNFKFSDLKGALRNLV
jgi:uncharacterized protein